jgi:hypothetical protein
MLQQPVSFIQKGGRQAFKCLKCGIQLVAEVTIAEKLYPLEQLKLFGQRGRNRCGFEIGCDFGSPARYIAQQRFLQPGKLFKKQRKLGRRQQSNDQLFNQFGFPH